MRDGFRQARLAREQQHARGVRHALASGIVFFQNGVNVGRESVDIILSADLFV